MPDSLSSFAPVHDACCEGTSLHPLPVSRTEPFGTPGWAGEVGYVVMGYPRVSETFITQEIQVLEQLGARLRLFAVKQGDTRHVHANVARIRAPLVYLPAVTSLSGTRLLPWLWRNTPGYWRAHARLAARRPGAYLRTLASAVAMMWRYRAGPTAAPRKVFLKEFLQAGHVADQVLAAGTVRHLHGHFCHGATTITWMASRLTGLPFSFTAHAKDIYQADQNPGDLLPRKLRAAAFVATCTDANRRHLEALCPDRRNVSTIYHGLDTTFFSPAHRGGGPAVPTLLAVGRLVEKKGFATLIDACHRLRDAGHVFRCRIVGEDGDQRPEIEAKIRAHGLAGIVSLDGPVTHDTLRRHYADASLFVLPCLVASDGDRDGIPNVLAEAMAMGLPVVSTPVSGIPELVRAGRDGLLVAPADAAALAGAIARLLGDACLRRTLGDAARARVVDVFDAATTTVSLKRLFDATLSATAHPS